MMREGLTGVSQPFFTERANKETIQASVADKRGVNEMRELHIFSLGTQAADQMVQQTAAAGRSRPAVRVISEQNCCLLSGS